MEDYVTWVNKSSIKYKISKYNDKVRMIVMRLVYIILTVLLKAG